MRRPLVASDAASCLAAPPALADRGDVIERAGTRRKEEATVGAIFTEISQSWSVHESYLEAKKCTMTDRRGIFVLQKLPESASFRLLGFNVADEATAALDSIKITAGATERQPVLVAVRGAGGGKSRAVKELVVELNKRALPASMGDHVADPGVLGIAITFNHDWDKIVPLRDQSSDLDACCRCCTTSLWRSSTRRCGSRSMTRSSPTRPRTMWCRTMWCERSSPTPRVAWAMPEASR